MTEEKHAKLDGRLVMIGFGSIGQAMLPLLMRHIELSNRRVTIIAADDRGRARADEFGAELVVKAIKPDNYLEVLEPLLDQGDFLLNLSVDVSSVALLEFCLKRGTFYLDASIEPWEGAYIDSALSPSARSNYALREQMLELKRAHPQAATAVVTMGANPGLISQWVKQALVNIAQDVLGQVERPRSRAEWGRLAMRLGIKAIHCAERDTQLAEPRKRRGEFANTWSVDGFLGEGRQPSELGWGTHERHFPADGRRHEYGGGAAIYLDRPGMSVKVRSWTPDEGPFQGFLITHAESISIADYLTVEQDGELIYRPTCHYAYHPCDDAVLSIHEMAGNNWVAQPTQRIFMDEIYEGVDELGALLVGHEKNAYWFGSRLSIQQARRQAPYNNATSLQVVAGILGGMVWALENPRAGVVEPDELDYRRVLDIANPYLGDIVGKYTDWTPLDDRGRLFDELLDTSDPWQFLNLRVA